MTDDELVEEEVDVEPLDEDMAEAEAGDTTHRERVMEAGDDDDEANNGEALATQGGDGSHDPIEMHSGGRSNYPL